MRQKQLRNLRLWKSCTGERARRRVSPPGRLERLASQLELACQYCSSGRIASRTLKSSSVLKVSIHHRVLTAVYDAAGARNADSGSAEGVGNVNHSVCEKIGTTHLNPLPPHCSHAWARAGGVPVGAAGSGGTAVHSIPAIDVVSNAGSGVGVAMAVQFIPAIEVTPLAPAMGVGVGV